MSRSKRLPKRKNMPLLIPIVAAAPSLLVGVKTMIGASAIIAIGSYGIARSVLKSYDMVPEVDMAVFDSLSSRQDYAALAEFFGVLSTIAKQGHTFTKFDELKEAYGGASPSAMKAPAETVAMAHLLSANYLMEAYLLSGDVTASEKAVEDFNAIKTASLNPAKAPELISKVLTNAYALILGVEFKDKRSKFRVINALSYTLSTIGISAAQFDQSNIDLVVQEEVLAAKCKSEKPIGAIIAALSFKPKPVCYTDEEWFYLKIGAWGGLISLTGLLLLAPLNYARTYGEMLGVITSTIKTKKR